MDKLNLPLADLRLRDTDEGRQVFDVFRKKWVSLSPEEWVRQHLLHYLTQFLGYPGGRIGVEKAVPGSGPEYRSDIVVYDTRGKAALLIEVKAASVKLDTSVFDQAARYNIRLGVPYLIVSNGLTHYCARILHQEKRYEWMDRFPSKEELI